MAMILLTVGACGDESAGNTRASADERGTAVVCDDQAGDVEPLLQFEPDEVVLVAADLIETTLRVEDESLLVEWTFAEGASGQLEVISQQRMEVELEPAEGGYPVVALDVARFADEPPAVGVSVITAQGGPATTEDVDGVRVEARRDTISMLVPVHLLRGVGNHRWRWTSTSSAGRLASDDVQRMGQDACGSGDAGAGSKIVYFPGPDLPAAKLPKQR